MEKQINDKAVRNIIKYQWNDMVFDAFKVKRCLSDFFDEDALFWDILFEFHNDYFEERDFYIALYRNEIEKRISLIQTDFQNIISDLKTKYCL